MPIKKSAYKELRKSKKRHLRNISIKSELRTMVKKFEVLAADKKLDEAKASLKSLCSVIDKAASRGIIHKNAASRKTSRLMKRLSSLSKA